MKKYFVLRELFNEEPKAGDTVQYRGWRDERTRTNPFTLTVKEWGLPLEDKESIVFTAEGYPDDVFYMNSYQKASKEVYLYERKLEEKMQVTYRGGLMEEYVFDKLDEEDDTAYVGPLRLFLHKVFPAHSKLIGQVSPDAACFVHSWDEFDEYEEWWWNPEIGVPIMKRLKEAWDERIGGDDKLKPVCKLRCPWGCFH